jgi:hypothetical protein
MWYYDTAHDWDPRNLMSHHGLVGLKIINPSGGTYYAHFLCTPVSHSRLISFDKWWEKIVIVDEKKNKFSRKSLILSITNMDGGAHIDPEIEESYLELTRFNSVGWKFTSNGEDLKGVELHSIRQIAEEFLESLKLKSPNLFTENTL